MDHNTEVLVGIDVPKSRGASAIIDGEREGDVRFIGAVDAWPESMRQSMPFLISSALST